eukprot:CAMPEP_0177513832 /NCGR_PEP_ID=MMETSP0369-20130122/43981_1 /TAXON_ID=447022 ORGANISM="Scrippsiella hangoei-like, Strain SHHI-4" /NCGR_SAMPLE_ID=MMETSP0369 /ASSEMBLY_ACC=CAM_ASM_000364 /LENGTH=79 /DNA_ID=CAMNT_0018992457 /DNA_START=210 /DNA_END=446 /DNA_ORIENTATION=+
MITKVEINCNTDFIWPPKLNAALPSTNCCTPLCPYQHAQLCEDPRMANNEGGQDAHECSDEDARGIDQTRADRRLQQDR